MTMKRCIYILIVVVACVGLTGCRGVRSEKPPIHPNVNMDYQPRFDKQELPMDLPDGVVPYSYVTTAPTDASRSQIMKSGKPAGYYTGESPWAVCAACADSSYGCSIGNRPRAIQYLLFGVS